MKCQKCHQKEASQIWAGDGGVWGYIHGQYSQWCDRCVVSEQLKHARERAAEIPELERRLVELSTEVA